MRFRSFILWTVGLALLGWAGYTAASAAASYMATREMVDQVLQEARPKARAAASAGDRQPFDDLADDVRQTLLVRARRYGVPLDERDLAVLSADGGLTVKLKWSYRVITYGGSAIVMIPMSLERSLSTR